MKPDKIFFAEHISDSLCCGFEFARADVTFGDVDIAVSTAVLMREQQDFDIISTDSFYIESSQPILPHMFMNRKYPRIIANSITTARMIIQVFLMYKRIGASAPSGRIGCWAFSSNPVACS